MTTTPANEQSIWKKPVFWVLRVVVALIVLTSVASAALQPGS
jgi:hypothetical protein